MSRNTPGTVGKKNWGYPSPIIIDTTGVEDTSFTQPYAETRYALIPGDSRIGSNDVKIQQEILTSTKVVMTWKSAAILVSGSDYAFLSIRQNRNGDIVIANQVLTPVGVPSNASKIDYLSSRLNPNNMLKAWDSNFFVQGSGTPNIEFPIPVFKNENDADNYLKSSVLDPTEFGGEYIGGGNENPDDVNNNTNISGGNDNKTGVSDYTGVASSGIMDLVEMDTGQLSSLSKLISAGWLAGDIGKGIMSIKYIKTPGDIPANSTSVIITDKLTEVYEVTGQKINTQIKNYGLGSFAIPAKYNSFLDYEPYTSIQLYLPYCGIQEISPKDVIGNMCVLSVSVDFLTGNCVYYLYLRGDNNKILYTWNGNCCMDIPINVEDFGRKISNVVGNVGNMMISGAVASTTGSPVAAANVITGGIATAQSIVSKDSTQVGNMGSNNGFGGIQYPYLILRRPKSAEPSNYAHIKGIPSMKNATIGSLKGYTEMQEFVFTSNTATSEEKAEIEAILKSGFYA